MFDDKTPRINPTKLRLLSITDSVPAVDVVSRMIAVHSGAYDLQNAYSIVRGSKFLFRSTPLGHPYRGPAFSRLGLCWRPLQDVHSTYNTGSLPRILPHFSRTVPKR
jgi:hypothetical protein